MNSAKFSKDEVEAHIAKPSEAVLALRAKQAESIARHQRVIEHFTHALGRPATIYLTLLIASGWATYNLLAPHFSLVALDPPPFGGLQTVVSLAALIMTIAVLTTQNRQAQHAEHRAHVDLQVNLLAEQKIAKLIALVEELRRDLPNVHNRKDPLADAMTQAVNPDAISNALDLDPHSKT